MPTVSPLFVLLGGIAVLILLLHERARLFAALIVFVAVVIAAADLLAIDLRFWD